MRIEISGSPLISYFRRSHGRDHRIPAPHHQALPVLNDPRSPSWPLGLHTASRRQKMRPIVRENAKNIKAWEYVRFSVPVLSNEAPYQNPDCRHIRCETDLLFPARTLKHGKMANVIIRPQIVNSKIWLKMGNRDIFCRTLKSQLIRDNKICSLFTDRFHIFNKAPTDAADHRGQTKLI